MSSSSATAAAPASGTPRRSLVAPLAAAFFTLVAVAAFLVLFAGARFDYATAGLIGCSGALLFSLASLFQMVRSLSTPGESLKVSSSQLTGVSTSSLREEKRRLLRAINELKFDFDMGKLSQVDYDQVRETYELRAVEVMRALEGPSKLHPEVFALLEDRGLLSSADVENESSDSVLPEDAEPAEDAEPGPDAEASEGAEAAVSGAAEDAEDEPKAQGQADGKADAEASAAIDSDAMACGKCDGSNDVDAKFCKHCGQELHTS